MTEKELLARLNWFYTLEVNQVNYYQIQSKATEDCYIAKALEQIAQIEAEHVDCLREIIRQFGKDPTYLGEKLGVTFGNIAGYTSGLVGTVNMFKLNVLIETKAQQDYLALIKANPQLEFKDLLWKHAVDEDLHRAWFQEQQAQLRELKE